MNKITHTPGPWTVKKYDTTFVIESDGMRVLSTSWHNSIRRPYPLKPEALANATLAAAAPDLLAALKSATTSRPDWGLITSALAKAEGRS